NKWDLPNHLRPVCHQNGHNYPAVYGRMKWDEPSSTITAGFRSNGQGRFTHPSAKPGRPLTPHEAARIQTFPDWFSFDGHRPTTMAKTIGNAVPPLLAMYVAFVAIKSTII
ncbi:MAG: DNA cytosine methyltransferase, partial [Euryarchaeota archaeon]